MVNSNRQNKMTMMTRFTRASVPRYQPYQATATWQRICQATSVVTCSDMPDVTAHLERTLGSQTAVARATSGNCSMCGLKKRPRQAARAHQQALLAARRCSWQPPKTRAQLDSHLALWPYQARQVVLMVTVMIREVMLTTTASWLG